MDIYTAAIYIREGFKVKRSGQLFPALDLNTLTFIKLSLEDLLSTDWELVTEEAPITCSH